MRLIKSAFRFDVSFQFVCMKFILSLVSTDNFSFTKKVCSCKLNSVAKCHCQISVTEVCELSIIK